MVRVVWEWEGAWGAGAAARSGSVPPRFFLPYVLRRVARLAAAPVARATRSRLRGHATTRSCKYGGPITPCAVLPEVSFVRMSRCVRSGVAAARAVGMW